MKKIFIITLLLASGITQASEYCFNNVEITSDYIFVSNSTTNDIGTIKYIENQSLLSTTNPSVLRALRNFDGEEFCLKGRVSYEKKEVELYVPCEGFSSCRRIEPIKGTIFATQIY